jgi:hypothetical protein
MISRRNLGRLGVAAAGNPLRVGFSQSLSGGLAGNGRAALVAQQIWAEDANARGGLLGRQVQLVYYDDQSNGAQVPGIYTKLLDVDHVDLVVSGYRVNPQAYLTRTDPLGLDRRNPLTGGLTHLSIQSLRANPASLTLVREPHFDSLYACMLSTDSL